jgi:HlyD family secretion protein
MAQAVPSATPGRVAGPRPVVNFPSRRPPRWRWAVPAALLLVLAALAALYATGQLTTLQRRLLGQTATVTYQTATVATGTVAETVSATGPVAAAKTLPVNFTSSGRLVDLKVAVGQQVKKGDVLAQLDTTDLQAAVDQAKAALGQQQSNYNKLLAGATPEQIEAARVALANAQQAANDAAGSAAASQASAAKDVEAAQASAAASQNSLQAARDALAAAQEQAAAKLAADQTAVDNAQKALDAAKAVVATNPAIAKEQLDKARTDLWAAQITRDANCSRQSGGACEASRATVAGMETNVNTVAAQAAQTEKQNAQTLQNAQAALDSAKATLASDQVAQAATIKVAENNVVAAETDVNGVQVTIEQARVKAAASAKSAQASANSAVAQVKTAEASLATTAAPTGQADLDAQMASIQSALVAVKVAENNLVAATLRSPMDGTVTAVTGVVGQQVNGGAVNSTTSTTASTTTASSALITLQTLDDLQVTANVNEADVGKVKVGNPVAFTVSAFPGKTFAGQVIQIQPTGTTTSNVVTFGVTSSIKSVEGAALYPGMTAQVTVTTAEQRDVLLVPNSALTYAKNQATTRASGTAAGTRQAGQAGAAASQGGAAAGQSGAAAAGQTGAAAGQAGAGGQAGQSAGGTQSTVMVLENGAPVAVRVTTGMTDGTNTAVTAGLRDGQAVVTGQTGGATGTTTATGATGQRASTQSSPLTVGGPGGGPPAGIKPGG